VVAALCGLVLSASAFVGKFSSVASPRQLRGARAGSSVLDFLKLPDTVTDAFDDVADMLGQGGTAELPAMEVSTFGMAEDGSSRNGLLQTMSIRSAAGSERKASKMVMKLVEGAKADPLVMTAVATQNPEDPCDFVVMMRYTSMDNMQTHQTGSGFEETMNNFEGLLEKPVGLFITDEYMGELGMARHPFGPGGEGGRDDAIYSSRSGKAASR